MRREDLLLYILILASYLIFFGCMVISAGVFFTGKPVQLREAMISGLLSPSDNPRGYRIASAGTAICGVLLLPVALLFYRALARRHRVLALAGSVTFGLGPLCAASILLYAGEIDDTHVYLAFAAYIFMTLGLLIGLALEGSTVVRAGGIRGGALLLALAALTAILIFLVYLLFTPDFFNDQTLLRNVAFCEWSLCAVDALCIVALARMLAAPTR